MDRFKYITGDVTSPVDDETKIIAHCVSDNGYSYGKGLALQLAMKWPETKQDYKSTKPLQPAQVIITRPEIGVVVAAIVGQHGLGPKSLRLRWLYAGLCDVALLAIESKASVHIPRIGCGLAGGKWEEIGPTIEGIFNAPLASFIDVYVYDLPK